MNKTQCPNCLTDYTISDEQLRLSQGKVRCGKCLEQFDAYAELNKEKTVFDPRSAFIEPLSYYEEEHLNIGVDDILPDSRSVEFKDSSVAPVKFSEITPLNQESEKEVIPDESKVELNEILKQHARDAAKQKEANSIAKISGTPPRPSINSTTMYSLADNFDPELSVHLYDDDYDDDFTEDDAPSVENSSTRFLDPSTSVETPLGRITESSIQFDEGYLEEPSIQYPDSEKKAISSATRVEPQLAQVEIELEDIEQLSETVMLDDVDYAPPQVQKPARPVIQEPVVAAPTPVSTPKKSDNAKRDIRLNNTAEIVTSSNELNIEVAKKTRIWAWILIPLLLLLVSALAITFTYQLWQKQFISWPDQPEVRAKLEQITDPVSEKLDELNIVPVSYTHLTLPTKA